MFNFFLLLKTEYRCITAASKFFPRLTRFSEQCAFEIYVGVLQAAF